MSDPVTRSEETQEGMQVSIDRLPLLLDIGQAAQYLNVGKRTFWKLHAVGRVPAPIKLGRLTRWRKDDLEAWVKAGCPARKDWHPENPLTYRNDRIG
jgi:excisionase family DNA binding protein